MEEWMGRLQVKAADCKYKENDRKLKEQFTSGINNEAIIAKIIKECNVLRDTIETVEA